MESKTPSKTPLVDSLDIKVFDVSRLNIGKCVFVSDLESALEKLPKVYGDADPNVPWSREKTITDTHEARLLGVQEIPKAPLKVVQEFIHENEGCYYTSIDTPIEMHGKKFRVTYEEIQESK